MEETFLMDLKFGRAVTLFWFEIKGGELATFLPAKISVTRDISSKFWALPSWCFYRQNDSVTKILYVFRLKKYFSGKQGYKKFSQKCTWKNPVIYYKDESYYDF